MRNGWFYGNHPFFIRKGINMNDIACPYKLSGLCYRKGCIHLPELDCTKKWEKHKLKRKKGGKRK